MSENTLKVGDRVQNVEYGSKFVRDGVIESIVPSKKLKTNDYWRATPEEQAEMVTFANVKWDDGTTEQLDMEELAPQDSEMERDFRKAYWSNEERIQEKLDAASALIREAVKISEETGVPFRAHVSPLSNSYFPRSREEKFPELDSSFISEVSEAYNEYDSVGWQHSAVC